MNGANQKFRVQVESGEVMEAELLTLVVIDQKRYAIYAIDNHNGSVDILASEVIRDNEGYDELTDVTDPLEKQKIANFLKTLSE